MPKLPSLKPKEVVPIHLKDIAKGTLSAVLREAEIDRDAFIGA